MVGMSRLSRTCRRPDPAQIYSDSLRCAGNSEMGIGYWGFGTLRGSRRKTIHNIFLSPLAIHQFIMDNEIEEIIECLKLKHLAGVCGTYPNDHCFSNRYVHWVLDHPKFMLWAAHIIGLPSIPTWTYLTVLSLQMVSRATPFAGAL